VHSQWNKQVKRNPRGTNDRDFTPLKRASQCRKRRRLVTTARAANDAPLKATGPATHPSLLAYRAPPYATPPVK